MANFSPTSKPCPNCGARNPSTHSHCVICGHHLATGRGGYLVTQANPQRFYSSEEGEDDLVVHSISSISITGALVSVFFIALCLGILGGIIILLPRINDTQATSKNQTGEKSPTVYNDPFVTYSPNEQPLFVTSAPSGPTVVMFPTNTRAAPLLLPTVTPQPVTPTFTPTEAACIQTARAGDSVYAMALRCGHRDLSVVDLIVEANPALECANCLREGQTLEIPWPTPTPDESGALLPAVVEVTAIAAAALGEALPTPNAAEATPEAIATLFVEPTLRPGLMWHRVASGETLISIASQYSADAKVLSDLNPEIEFRQCDFSMKFGGPNCNVIFYVGQQVRVPAPPPTATIPPTPSGSETPTPTATATFNVPISFSPADGTLFDANSLVTLRWSATGTLAANEAYLITVINTENNTRYTAQTTELFFVLPTDWQPRSDTVVFEWTVEIVTLNENNQPTGTRERTILRRFSWQGK